MNSLGAQVILYLDYDGVLHGDEVYRTKKGIVLKGSGRLFEHVAILVEVLEQHPDVRIILSTSWVREFGFNRAMKYLLPALQAKVIGATYHSSFEQENVIFDVEDNRIPWGSFTRYEQIASHVKRHQITRWLAIDNDALGWPRDQKHRLVHTDDWLGLGETVVQTRLIDVLQTIMATD